MAAAAACTAALFRPTSPTPASLLRGHFAAKLMLSGSETAAADAAMEADDGQQLLLPAARLLPDPLDAHPAYCASQDGGAPFGRVAWGGGAGPSFAGSTAHGWHPLFLSLSLSTRVPLQHARLRHAGGAAVRHRRGRGPGAARGSAEGTHTGWPGCAAAGPLTPARPQENGLPRSPCALSPSRGKRARRGAPA